MSVKELRQRPFHTEMKLNRSHDTTLDCFLGYWLTWSVYWDLMTSFSLILNLRTWEQANIKQQQQHDFEFIWRSSVFSFHQKFTGIRKCPSNSIKNTEHFVKTLAGPLVTNLAVLDFKFVICLLDLREYWRLNLCNIKKHLFLFMPWCLSIQNYVKSQVYLLQVLPWSSMYTFYLDSFKLLIKQQLAHMTHTCLGSHPNLNPYRMLQTGSPGRCAHSKPPVKNKNKTHVWNKNKTTCIEIHST